MLLGFHISTKASFESVKVNTMKYLKAWLAVKCSLVYRRSVAAEVDSLAGNDGWVEEHFRCRCSNHRPFTEWQFAAAAFV